MPRKRTKVILGASVASALVASGVVAFNADAAVDATPKNAVQAEAFSAQNGVRSEGTADGGGGQNLAYLGSGDWAQYNGQTLGATVSVRASSNEPTGGSIELHAGTPTGALLATFTVPKTNGWQDWKTVTVQSTGASAEKQNVVALIKCPQQGDCVNVNWFVFAAAATTTDPLPSPSATTSATPKPTDPTTPPTSKPPAGDPTTKPPTGGGTPAHSGPGWVPINQEERTAELAAFNATKAVRIHNSDVAEFHAACKLSHSAPDDPIVFPGMAGASHIHDFFGNNGTDANSTNASLRANKSTSCEPNTDLGAYWVPQLLRDAKDGENGQPGKVGTPIPYQHFTAYYGNSGFDVNKIEPFPAGLKMITGDAKLQNDKIGNPRGDFFCPYAEKAAENGSPWPTCKAGTTMIFMLGFPSCWDGVNLDSPDHKSHMSFNCNAEYPVRLPSLLFEIAYSVPAGAKNLSLSSGLPSSMHGDFMNGWVQQSQYDRIKTCLTLTEKCGEYVPGDPEYKP